MKVTEKHTIHKLKDKQTMGVHALLHYYSGNSQKQNSSNGLSKQKQ